MSERKVLNKYYPPDFDPSKIPRMRMPKNRKFCVRLMAPCNMRCDTCREYISKGRKFNARKEDVDDISYLGIRIYRFYIKCTRCLSEISFRTDPENTDYVLEAGATRNFQALKLAEEAAEREENARLEEEKNNPMKLLEKRTQQSKYEMDMLETLEELKELNQRQGAGLEEYSDEILRRKAREAAAEVDAEEAEDEALIQSVFGAKGADGKPLIRRLQDSDDSDDEKRATKQARPSKIVKTEKKSDVTAPTTSSSGLPQKPTQAWEKSLGSLGTSSKKLIKSSLVKVKPKSEVRKLKPPDDVVVAGVVVKEEPAEPSDVASHVSATSSSSSVPIETDVVVKTEQTDEEKVEQKVSIERNEEESSLLPPPVAVPALESSFALGLAAGGGSSGPSGSGAIRGTAFYNPFGAYGSGSSDSDSD